jgi:hypothetical protein
MTYQEIVKAIASLPVAERDSLLELIRQQQIEQQRDEMAATGERVRQAAKIGTAQNFENVEDLKSYLQKDLEDEVHYIDRDGNPLSYHIKDLYPVDVSFDFNNYFTTKVYALPDDFMRDEVIIGRNILNCYVINLDGRNGVFTIS